ncbi:putative ribonuclease H-like domain-containing protein [Tanacetum coccineum]|uniref:Ribonuclease H-like domain-containing protein n=2 Tax=Tanacetum coccineum TaxID=301880 RepID=A0ABQ5BIE9_9ASTR
MSEAEPIPPTSSVTALRIPMIKKGEYDLWSMKMRQYIAITDHILWDIITNGDQATTDPASSSAPKTSLAANARRNNEKALNILLSAIPDRHLLSFHDATNAKTLWTAIKARFGGNEASKKMQKNLLKQQFETFTIGSREELDSDEIICSFFAQQASMPTTHDDEDLLQIDEDAMEEIDIRWQVAMITARIRKFMRKTGRPIDLKPKNGITFDKSKIECFNCQKLGHFARECRFAKYQENRANGRQEKRIVAIEDSNSKALVATDNNEDIDWTKEFDAEPVTYAMMALTEVEQDDWSMEFDAEHMHFGQDGLGDFDWSNKADDTPVSLALMATNSEVPYCSKCSKSYKKLLESYQTERDNFQKARTEILGYQMSLESLEVILKTHEKNEYAWGDKYEQMEYDLKIRDLKLEEKQKELDQALKERDDFKVKLEKWSNASVLQNEVLNKQRYLSDKSCIGFGVESSSGMESDNSSGNTNSTDSLYPNFQKTKGFHSVPPPTGTIIPPRANVSFTGIDELAIRNKVVNQEKTKTSQSAIDRNKVIIEDWVDNLEYHRQYFHEVLMEVIIQGWIIEDLESQVTHHHQGPSILQWTPHRPQRLQENVKSIWVKKGSTVGSQAVLPQTVKKSAMINPKQTWKPKGNYLDSVNRGNGSYTLKQFEAIQKKISRTMLFIDSGYVAFGNDSKGGRISGKGTIKTSCLDFEKVSYVEELKFNLLSVSQICDKKHNVLFTDKECLILSPKFKFVDEDLRMKLSYGTEDWGMSTSKISTSWLKAIWLGVYLQRHSSLITHVWHVERVNSTGHLARRLRKGCHENSLCLLHMDLFGPVSVESINKKKYCLVVTDDCSKFSWVFFLAYKDETYDMLHDLIVGLENRLRHKVKTIRCDHGTEFKNQLMNEFCAKKGIKREYSIARTPQQNGVAERKNRTLIEAARTMLADSLLPIQFWAEAVNTACYVLNRVLVTKPQMKTPYEILMGRSPNISFMRPFGCSLTILNTLDHLGKFDGKSEEGYLLGYSTNSKGFRVYNRVTRKVQDCLHVNFLENQENQKGKGPDWMFDLDLLTPSMNYIPVREENYADSKEQGISCDDVEDLDDQQFIVHTAQPMHPEERTAAKEVSLSSEEQALHDELVSLMHQESLAKSHNDDQRIAFEEEKRRISIAKGKEHVDSTFTLSTANTPPQSTGNTPTDSDDDTPKDGIFSTNSFDAEEGGVADYNNMDPTIDVPSTPTLRIHKIHPQSQIIGKKEPKIVSKSLADKSWVEAMQEELLQFKLQEVWVLCDTYQKAWRVDGTKWVFRNKRLKGVLFIKNKARCCTQGYTRRSVDYDEMDVIKLHFCMSNSQDDVYVKQPPGFEDPASSKQGLLSCQGLYGLHQAKRWYYVGGMISSLDPQVFSGEDFEDLMQKEFKMSSMGELTFFLGLQVKQSNGGIFLSQDKYVKDILNKFDFRTIKPASTPIEAHKSLGKDEEGEDVDVHLYRSMIGCLMYLTASRPDIMFAVCISNSTNLGLWYPKDSPFHLEAFSDSDYAGDNHDRRSTSGGCQYLGRRLVSWQCKKQTIVAISSTEAEYVAAASCCAQSTICIVKYPVSLKDQAYSRFDITSFEICYEQRRINGSRFITDDNVSRLLTKALTWQDSLFGGNNWDDEP